MSFIELPLDIDDIQEDKPVPEGEYTLVIAKVKEQKNEAGELKGILAICEIEGYEDAANVMHNVSLPLPGDDSEKVANKLKFLKRFLSAFSVPTKGSTINIQDWLGRRAKVFLTQEEYNSIISNKIKLPPIK